MTDCPFTQYCVPGLLGGSLVLGLLLLRICGGKRLTGSDYLIGLWNLFAFVCHASFDAFLLYSGRLTRKAENEPVPKPDDYLGCYNSAIRKMWRDYADADVRFYADEYQSFVTSFAYAHAIVGSVLTFLTFFGYLRGGKWSYGMQIAAATWHLAATYWYFMPEYLTGFKNIKNFNYIAGVNAPIVVLPPLAILHGLCKVCCGDKSSSCQVASTSGAEQKKKKQ